MGVRRKQMPLWRLIGMTMLAVALLVSEQPGSARAQGVPAPAAKLPSAGLKQLQDAAAELYRRGEYDAALTATERTLAATRTEFGNDSEQVYIQSYGLGLVAESARRFDVMERTFREALRVGDIVYGRDNIALTHSMEKLAEALIALGRPSEAEPLVRKILAARGSLVGPNHSYNASAHAVLGAASLARGDASDALKSYREAVRLLTATRETQTIAKLVAENTIRMQAGAFSGLVEAAWRTASLGAPREPLAEESFEASQRAWTTSAASALQRMSARLAVGQTDLGRRIRRQQEATERVLALHQEDTRELARWSEVQKSDPAYTAAQQKFRDLSITQMRQNAPTAERQTALVGQLQALLARCPPGQKKSGCEKSDAEREKISQELGQLSQASAGPNSVLMAAHRELEAAEAKLPGYREYSSARKARIEEEARLDRVAGEERKAIVAAFPSYIALIEPDPLTVQAVQAMLGPSEALVTMLVGAEQTFVWAISRERTQWARVELGQRAVAAEVTALRLGLDPLAAPVMPDGRLQPLPVFDVGRAHALYRSLLGPVEAVVRGKSQLILVPTGPLTSLPFQVLVTEPPPPRASAADAVRGARWLVRTYATSVLPSVPSLAALRRTGQSLQAAQPFLGIGDPALSGPPPSASGRQRSGSTAIAAVWRNGQPDLRALRELLPLPETAAELKAIAAVLKAPPGALLLGRDATETRLKQTQLDHYRVVHFATHGLVAGELSGLGEPALVLTPPASPSPDDDGLLTASEVAGLKLSADWVVLSACNTAAGSDVGAEALSGLARAFFFAGARSLLVSHWAVNSEAAVWLTTGTFDALAKQPGIGRAEAFRRTMLAMIDAGLPPTAWAPFVIVGEGK